jgi:hypothetical protein
VPFDPAGECGPGRHHFLGTTGEVDPKVESASGLSLGDKTREYCTIHVHVAWGQNSKGMENLAH